MGLLFLVGLAALGIWAVLGFPDRSPWIGPRPKPSPVTPALRRLLAWSPDLGPSASRGSSLQLRSEMKGKDVRSLWLRLRENGDLAIEGQDLGPSVEEWWGGSEYEWDITIKAADVPAYVRCLGGQPGDDVLGLVRARYDEDPSCVQKGFLEARGIPIDFWSRVGE